MEFARHLLRVFAALLITALASNTANAGASALYAGQVSEHGSNAADYVQISNAELIEGLSAALTSGGNVNATQIGATVGASGFENNYLTHAEELMRIQAQIDCSQGDQASCETFADLQQLDADRDEFLAGCIGNYSDDCRGIRSHLTRTVAEYVEIAQQLDNAGISSDPTAGLPGYGMERKEALFQFSTYADVNDEFDFSDLVSTDMQSSLARSILQGDLSSATITSVNMLAAADVMQLGAEAGSGIFIPLPQGAALSASAMLQMEFGMDVLDAFGLGGGFTSVGGGAISRTTTDAGAPNRTVTDFIDGVTVVDRRTGTTFTGTVDLRPTLDRIDDGIPHPHRNDGSTFRNREGLLPSQPDGYYTEFVHPTPGVNGPGPQRIIRGQGGELYYTPDHYGSFIPLNQ